MYEFLLAFGVVLWAGMLVWYLRQPAASAFHPATFYLFFHFVLFTLRPVLAHWYGFDAIYRGYEFTPSLSDKITVLLGADLALVVFVLVALKVGNAPLTLAPGTARRQAEPRFTPSLLATFAICLPIAVAALATDLGGGNVGSMTRDAGTGIAINTSGNGYLKETVLMLGPLALLFAWAGRFRWGSLLPLLLFILVKAGTGGRWPFVMAAMSAGLYWMYEHRLRWVPPRVLIAAVPLLLLFTVIGTDRGASVRWLMTGERPTQTASDYFSSRPLESMDYANMEFFEYIVHVVPAKTGTYDYFLSNLQILTEPVPRTLWSGKPIGAPIKRFNLFDHGYPIGMTYSVAGAGWMQAGWLGIMVWAGLFGLVYGWIYNAYVRSDQDRYKTAAFIIFLPISLACFRDGILLSVLKLSLFTVLPVLVWRGLLALEQGRNGPAMKPLRG